MAKSVKVPYYLVSELFGQAGCLSLRNLFYDDVVVSADVVSHRTGVSHEQVIPMKQTLLAIAGGALGGTLGYFIFFELITHGLYGMIIPGGLLGIGAGLARSRSLALPVACGVAALLLGLFTEWRFQPFRADASFTYFLRHVTERDFYT